MSERLQQLLNLLPEHIRSLPPTRLFVLLGLIGTIVTIGLVSLLWISGSTEHRVLYTQLTMEDAGAITVKLGELQVPYSLEGDGTTILVPADRVHDLRLRLATEGLPQGGGAGFELFDQRSFGMTEFMQKLNYQRALQGELARTIMQLTAVKHARIHIVLPEKSLFVAQQEKTTASVVLKLAPAHRLTSGQIRGIVHLVGSSVEGLDPADITVVDTNGTILSQEQEEGDFLSQTQSQMAHQQTFEQNLERRVQSLLERAVGKGKVLVRVTATLDFQHVERTEERFDGDNPAIRSEQRNKEQGSGSGFAAVGIPGARSNVPDQEDGELGGGDQATMARQNETINYELSKVVSKIVIPSGAIKQLSVAVLVDGMYKPGENGTELYVPRTTRELTTYQNVVKSAIGYNEARGDQVEVANVPFEPQDDLDTQELAQEAQQLFWLKIGRYGAYVLLGLLFILFIGRPLVRWLTGSELPMPIEPELPRTVQELEATMDATSMLPEGGEGEEEVSFNMPTGHDLRLQMAEFVRTEPERAVEILRVWLRG